MRSLFRDTFKEGVVHFLLMVDLNLPSHPMDPFFLGMEFG